MKICLSLVHLTTASLLLLHIASAQSDLPQARIVSLNVDPEQVVVLHLRPGYVSSVRVLEEVSRSYWAIRGLSRPTTPKPSRSWCFSKQPAQNLRKPTP